MFINMATINNVLNIMGNATEKFFNKENSVEKNWSQTNGEGQTCLEKVGFEARYAHLMRNEWKREFEYTRPLVLSEYAIQQEFKVSTSEDIANIEYQNAERRAQEREIKAQEKARKKAEKRARKETEKQKNKENRKEPLESTYEVLDY